MPPDPLEACVPVILGMVDSHHQVVSTGPVNTQ